MKAMYMWMDWTLTINCKNSPSSVGGEMNCNKIKKNTCSGLGNVLQYIQSKTERRLIYNEIG